MGGGVARKIASQGVGEVSGCRFDSNGQAAAGPAPDIARNAKNTEDIGFALFRLRGLAGP